MARQRRRRKKPYLSKLMKAADAALSVWKRNETKKEYKSCPFCQKNPIQCNFHFVRRRRKIVRWEPDNTIGACHSCNYKEYRNPDPYRVWYIKRFGLDAYVGLVDRSEKEFEPDEAWLIAVIKKYGGQVPGK